MPYAPFNADWKDANSATGGGDTSTPLTATALDHIELGIVNATAIAEDAIDSDIVDAKGDLIVGTAADTVARKAVGADDEVLAGDSAQSTGVVWKKIGNAMVATDAAVAVSKLAGDGNDKYLRSVAGVPTWDSVAATSYTPAWTSAGTQPAIGNGTLTGRYCRIGDVVFGYVQLVFGTTTTAGTGQWFLSPPVTPLSTSMIGGTVFLHDPGVAVYPASFELSIGASLMAFLGTDGATQRIGVGVPFTWGSTDFLIASFFYEAS